MMKLECVLEQGAKMPSKAHASDAGFDLYALKGQCIPAKGGALFETGVHINIPEGYAGLLVSKSGLNVKNITSTGLIDAGYTGPIKVKMYNHGDTDYVVETGDKISQLVIFPIANASLVTVDEFTESQTERGDKGFGSSGR